jgi:hypothetical protein
MEKSRLLFTPETPLGQDVQSLLLQHPEGLRLDEIRRLLRREKGLHVTPENLQELLGNTRTFSLPPGDRYILVGGERPAGKPSSSEKIDHQHVENLWDSPLIVNLPIAQRDYVAELICCSRRISSIFFPCPKASSTWCKSCTICSGLRRFI